MGSLIRKFAKAKKQLSEQKKKEKIARPDTDAMISKSTLMVFRLMMAAFFLFAIVLSGRAPNRGPKLPEGVRSCLLPVVLLIAFDPFVGSRFR
jgi:hypothetical protein